MSTAPVSAEMVNNKPAVVANLQADMDCPLSLNTARVQYSVPISKQLGISMSDHVEVLYSLRGTDNKQQDCSSCSHTGSRGRCTEREHGLAYPLVNTRHFDVRSCRISAWSP